MPETDFTLDPAQTGVKARQLEASLKALVVGQDEAIGQIVNLYQTYLAGLAAPGRPLGNFLFLGPTGSGKTRMVEAAAESLLQNSRAMLKIDCAEFQHSHEIAKLIGSPPGYLGHRETHALLSQEVLNQWHTGEMKISFVLFDEIEKASDALWNLLLGILDKGTLTLGDNRKVDFSNAMIFMTSNIGASEMSALVSPRFGFMAGELSQNYQAGRIGVDLNEKILNSSVAAARRKFSPEFLNRIDRVVTFRPLGPDALSQILDIELRVVQQRIFNALPETSFMFELTAPAKALLLREGTDVNYGARHLKRAIERRLVQPLSNLIASHQIKGGDCIRVDREGALDRLTFIKQAEGVPCPARAPSSSHMTPTRATAAGRSVLFDAAKAHNRVPRLA
jgi:ATP-dependent Clp protease ATP-binding subunit ClpA